MATTTTAPAALDENKLHAFMGQMVQDLGAGLGVIAMIVGNRLGLYQALHHGGAQTSAQLAKATNTNERYVREWLVNQTAAGYLTHDAASGRYALPAEHAMALAVDTSPVFLGGMLTILDALTRTTDTLVEAFRTGDGILWGDHHAALFEGTERFFGTLYRTHLLTDWLPALDGVEAKLRNGARVADIGCGHGASTLLMAETFRTAQFHGFDFHPASISRAQSAARDAGFAERVHFAVADSASFPDGPFDVVCFFDCYHDMGNPVGAARRAFETLADDGTVMLVEPMAGRSLTENFNPLGRLFSGASVTCCTPNAMATGGHALGTVATDEDILDTLRAAGFTRVRRATETPFNRIFEARK